MGFGSVGIGEEAAGSGIGGASGTGGGAVAVDGREAGGPAGLVASGVQRCSCAGLSVNTLPPDGDSHLYKVAAASSGHKAPSRMKNTDS
jgi:hypothetical protein